MGGGSGGSSSKIGRAFLQNYVSCLLATLLKNDQWNNNQASNMLPINRQGFAGGTRMHPVRT